MKNIVTFNPEHYSIYNKPVWLASGEIHYFKIQRDDWRRRLLQIKLAGFNAVSVYMPWNYHEVTEGGWDFSGEKDVAHFLQLAAEFGLYVIARPGPYICDEWQFGGFPPWLSGKSGIRLRSADSLFLSYCDLWWDRIASIIADYQIGKKGSIILVQIENEYGHFGDNQEPEYIYHLRDGLLKHGIHVPLINCDSFIQHGSLKPGKWDGVNLCGNFGGDGLRILKRARKIQEDAPLFVTEYWMACFDCWGCGNSNEYDDNSALYGGLEIVAGGAAGLTTFVFSGGAHFAYWHGGSSCSSDGRMMATLYGPGAPILDDGRFSKKYYLFKTNFTGVRAAENELAQSAMPELSDVEDGLIKAVRKGPCAEFDFYINQSAEKIIIADREKERADVDMSIPAGAVTWHVKNLPLGSGFVLQDSSASLFCISPALVLFEEEGKKVFIDIMCPDAPDAESMYNFGFTASIADKSVKLEAEVPGSRILNVILKAGEFNLNIILIDKNMVEQCWRIELPGMPERIFGGAERIEDVYMNGSSMHLKVSNTEKRSCWQATEKGYEYCRVSYLNNPGKVVKYLKNTFASSNFPETGIDFDDSSWFYSHQPQAMAKFGHGQGWAWYRAEINVKKKGPQAIHLSGAGDRLIFFVDGEFLTIRGIHSHKGLHCMPYLQPGMHTLAIMTENLGMANTGAEDCIALGEPKGLFGPVWLNGEEICGWRMRQGLTADEELEYWEKAGKNLKWSSTGKEAVKGPVWVKAEFDLPDDFDGAVRLVMENAAGKGSVWVNGHSSGRYWKIGPQQSLWIPLGWLKSRNSIVIFEEMEIDPSQIKVSFQPFGFQAEIELGAV